MTRFHDRLTIDAGGRRTEDGYFVTSVRAARTGIQMYRGSEVGKPGMDVVRVYRPESAVFDKKSLASFAFRPITIGHPRDGVDATNWRDLSRGITGGEVVRDGEFVRVPLALMDEKAIKNVEDGRREISMGYDAVLEFVDGVTPDGEQYDAVQSDIRMNHLAIVDAARGGSELRIGDNEEEPRMANRTVIVDGLSVETTDQGAQAIDKLLADRKTLQDKLTADAATSGAKIGEITAALATKTGELAVATKAIDDGKLTPAKLDAAVTVRSAVIVDAKKIAGDTLVVDGKTNDEIRRAAIAVHLGDEAAKAMSDAEIGGAFAFAAKQTNGGGTSQVTDHLQPLRAAIAQPVNVTDVDKAHDTYVKGLTDAWQTAGQSARAN